MTADGDNEVDPDPTNEDIARQRAEKIFNVRGNVNVYEADGATDSPEKLLNQLASARAQLESTKSQLQGTVEARGWNSYDARSIAETGGLVKDRVLATKRLLVSRGLEVPLNRFDAEDLGEANNRILQSKEAVVQLKLKQDKELREQAVREAQSRADAQLAKSKRTAEENQGKAIGFFVTVLAVIAGIYAVWKFLAWAVSEHPFISTGIGVFVLVLVVLIFIFGREQEAP